MENKTEFEYFLFVNTKSGGGIGKQYLQKNPKTIKFKFQTSICLINLIDLFDEKSREQSMMKVKELEEFKQIRVITCGGDGTIMWILNLAKTMNVNFQKVPFGILPIGTGNDFSRSLGWGYITPNFSQNKNKELQILVRQWNAAEVNNYDIWDVYLETFQSGCIFDIKNQKEIKKETKLVKKSFTNYCGMGLDARVVYTVQQARTAYAFFNKVVYGLVGTLNFFRPMSQLIKYIQSFVQYKNKGANNKKNQQIQKQKNEIIQVEQISEGIQQATMNQMQNHLIDIKQKKIKRQIQLQLKKTSEAEQIIIKQGYRGIVCLNCPSYMAGLSNVWSTRSVGRQNCSEKRFKKQKYNDGLIQFVGFKSQFNLALERLVRSGGKMVQGSGPFQFKFKQLPQNKQKISYIQIDGQSMKVVNLKSLKIERSKIFENGSIKVLVNKII